MLKRIYLGWFIVLVLCLTPVVLWIQSPAFAPRFGSFSDGMADLGRIFGLVGVAMFSINLILSAHLHFVEKLFNGLNKVYIKHAFFGKTAVILVLLHPLFLLARYSGGTFSGAINFLSFGPFWPKTWGQISLIIFIALIVLTLYLRPKYNIWKWTHKFMGLAFFFASMHVWLIPSDVARYMPLRVYVLSLAGIGLTAYLYHTLLGWLLIRKFKYRVINVVALNNNIFEVNMEPVNKPMQFTPGQFIFINFLDKNIGGESHPFSITSGINDKKFSILVKNLGDHTGKMGGILPGTIAKIEGPFGAFNYKNSKYKDQIWIAGGIGIAPFISMAKSLKKEDGYNIDLYYCVKNEAEAVHLNLLECISGALSNTFKVIPFYSEQGFRIDAEIVQKTSGRLSSNNDIFLCAPPAMIKALKDQFAAKGVSRKLMHSEEFNF